MKRLLICSVAFIAFVLVLSSCGDDEKGPAGKFTVDGESFNLAKGFAAFDGIYSAGDDDYYYWIIVLTSSDISADDDDELEGTGHAVVLEIAAMNDDSFIPEGSYSLDDETADSYGIYIDYNTATGTGTTYEDIADVSITISKSGNTFTINFTITLDDATVITGSYKGSITEIDS